MVLLNTTFHVHNSVTAEFIDWVYRTYIPKAMASGLFTDPIVSRILVETDPEGTSYAVQLRTNSHEKACQWHDNDAGDLKTGLAQKYGERILHFTTFMEIIKP